MTKRSLPLILAMLALALCSAPAQAQLARTFVSAEIGNDANDCNRLTPCRTFQRAHDATLASGEITVLDPGGYGAVTITKAISIINDGVGEAGVLVSGGFSGITINVGPSDSVALRGLTLKGLAGFDTSTGIRFNSGFSLTVENCVIRTMFAGGVSPGVGAGLYFAPSGASTLTVSNSVMTNNQGGAVLIEPTGSGSATVVVSRSELHYGLTAVGVRGDGSPGPVKVTVVDSVATGNNAAFGTNATTTPVTVMVLRSVANYNGAGLFAVGATARVLFSQTTIMGNSLGFSIGAGGQVLTYGDNMVTGNDSSETPTGAVSKI